MSVSDMPKTDISVSPRAKQLGINGERFVVNILERVIGKKRLRKGWFYIKHHDWEKNYLWGEGTDVTVYDEKGDPKVDIEVKNWKNQPKPYGTEIAETQIVPRFRDSFAPIRLLIISYLYLLTCEARDLIRQAGIQIIDIGNWIVKSTWATALKSFMLEHYRRFKNFLRLSSKPLSSKPTSTCKSLVTSIASYTTTDAINNIKNTEHDTYILLDYQERARQLRQIKDYAERHKMHVRNQGKSIILEKEAD